MIKKVTLRATVCATTIAVTLGIVAGFQLLGTSRDYENYIYFFQTIPQSTLFDLFEYRFEPGFAVLSHALVHLNLEAAGAYVALAFIALFVKLVAIKDIKNYWPALLLFLIFYLGRYYTLFEMTVLRAALAFSVGFYVFMRRSNDGYQAKDVLLLIVAVTLHFSALVFILIYLRTPKSRLEIIALAVAFFSFIILAKDAALNLLPQVFSVFSNYDDMNESSLLPKPMILDIAFLFFMLYKWNHADLPMKNAAYGFAIGLAMHFSLLEYTVFASRFRELLSLFLLIYVVRALDSKSQQVKIVTVGFAILSSSLHIYTAYVHDPLLT